MTLEALQRALSEHAQFVPFDAPRLDDATLGGTLAAGWIGPRRMTYGRPRDLLIGATIALADGTLASSGGMVVKNVTGYDMGKLYVGSHGTLGVLVRANFKVLPAPAARRLAISPFEADLRARVVAHARARLLEPTALLVIDGFGGVAAEGSRRPPPAARRALRRLGELGRTRDARIPLGAGCRGRRRDARPRRRARRPRRFSR